MLNQKMQLIEDFVKQTLTNSLGHDFLHVGRVRKWALKIARAEKYKDLDMVEATALLHDVARDDQKVEKSHGEQGAEIAKQFLAKHKLFSSGQIREIAHAIRHHNAYRGGKGKLLAILKDADRLDLLGAVGIIRACTAKHKRPPYNPKQVKGESWRRSLGDFNKSIDQGLDTGDYIIDQLNFQISCYYDLYTKSAKRLGKPQVIYLQNFILELEKEIKSLNK